jgi:hypothetical protein
VPRLAEDSLKDLPKTLKTEPGKPRRENPDQLLLFFDLNSEYK